MTAEDMASLVDKKLCIKCNLHPLVITRTAGRWCMSMNVELSLFMLAARIPHK